MNKLLLSVLAVATLSLATSTISAKYSETKKEEGRHSCNTCGKDMCGAKEKHDPKRHCSCSHQVCTQPVQAVKHAPMVKNCENKDRCPDNTTPRTNKHGQLECVETRAEEVLHRPICDETCTWSCPPGYEEEAMTSGHEVNKVHDNRHTAKSHKRVSKTKVKATANDMDNDMNMMEETVSTKEVVRRK